MSITHDLAVGNKLISKMILLVEDDVGIGELLIDVLKEDGLYQVVLATDGVQALKIVRNINPLLYVLDYQLPGMNGIELYDRLHAMKGLGDIPALFVSANIPLGELAKRHLQYISKPFELDQLLYVIKRYIV